MKAQFLKISGHKNEKDFYKEFPTHESFMAKHGAALNKAQYGNVLQTDANNNGVPDYLENPNQNMQQMGQMFPAGNVPQQGPQKMGSQISTLQNFNTNFSANNPSMNQGFGSTVKGMFSGGDAGNGGLGKAFGDIGQSFGIGGGGKGAAGAAKGMGGGGMSNAGGYIEAIMGIVKGVSALKGEKKMKRQARSDRNVVQLLRDAYDSKDVNRRDDYLDSAKRTRNALVPTVNADALFPTYGVGTNALGQSKNGKKIKANHGAEIMNTYAPEDIYQDLGYEPLEESVYQPVMNPNIAKSYEDGGFIIAQNGFNTGTLNNTLSMIGQNNKMMSLAGNYNTASTLSRKDNAGGDIGGGIGQAIGTYFGGPLGGMVGKWAGKTVGAALDPNARKMAGYNYQQKEDMNYMTNSTNLQNLRTSNFGAYTKNGGSISPQVIKYLGNNNVNDLFKADPMMDTLRTGGNLRSNSVGDVEAVSGGYLEPISYNPHTSGSGVTSMIKGQSHDESNGTHSGVILDYNGKNVEAERGEPISERQDGGSLGDSAVIAGDQTFNKLGSQIMPHLSKYEGKKIKNIQKEIAEKDAKLNKFDAKNSIALNDFNPRTAIDKLTMNSYVKNAEGIQQKYKINAREVDGILAFQEANNSTAKEMGVDAGDLSRGKLKPIDPRVARNGLSFAKDGGEEAPPEISKDKVKNTRSMADVPKGQHKSDIFYGKITQKEFEELKKENPWFDWDTFNPRRKGDVLRFQKEFNELSEKLGSKARLHPDDALGEQTASARIDLSGREIVPLESFLKPITDPYGKRDVPKPINNTNNTNYDVTPYQGNTLETLAGQILPWFRRPPGEDLRFTQIAGELSSLRETPDPVQARFYHPNLRQPYDISYQDQLNENQADFNQLVKSSGNNPQALAALAAQKYGANSKVLAEQFRANQAMKEGVYNQNINTLNDALIKNLGIADQQYVRQSTAASNTKEIKRAAMDSIASKTLQNLYENRRLQVGSNEFKDFSYDSGMRLNKTGAPTAFNIPQNYTPNSSNITHMPIYDDNGNITGYKEVNKASLKTARNGNIVKAFKNI